VAVGRKAEAAAVRIAPALRADVTVAAVLHDIGYGHVHIGFHPLEGARFFAREGFSPLVCNRFSPLVCNLVAHHSLARTRRRNAVSTWPSMPTSDRPGSQRGARGGVVGRSDDGTAGPRQQGRTWGTRLGLSLPAIETQAVPVASGSRRHPPCVGTALID
jgi:hypothetical protein